MGSGCDKLQQQKIQQYKEQYEQKIQEQNKQQKEQKEQYEQKLQQQKEQYKKQNELYEQKIEELQGKLDILNAEIKSKIAEQVKIHLQAEKYKLENYNDEEKNLIFDILRKKQIEEENEMKQEEEKQKEKYELKKTYIAIFRDIIKYLWINYSIYDDSAEKNIQYYEQNKDLFPPFCNYIMHQRDKYIQYGQIRIISFFEGRAYYRNGQIQTDNPQKICDDIIDIIKKRSF